MPTSEWRKQQLCPEQPSPGVVALQPQGDGVGHHAPPVVQVHPAVPAGQPEQQVCRDRDAHQGAAHTQERGAEVFLVNSSSGNAALIPWDIPHCPLLGGDPTDGAHT